MLISAGNSGLGAATVKFLAQHNPAKIYLCARPASVPSAEALVASIRVTLPDINLQILTLNLASLASVAACAAVVLRATPRLDLLVLNAGISTTAPALTTDGYESQFGVNHIGHARLAQLLLPVLLRTAAQGHDVRVLFTSSVAAHTAAPENGLALGWMREADALDSAYERYAHSKLANALFARALARRYPTLRCVTVDPGQVRTALFRKATGLSAWVRVLVAPVFMWLTGVSAEKGAENGLWAAVSEKAISGSFYEPVGVLANKKGRIADEKLAEELWEWTTKELAQAGGSGWPSS